MKIKQTIPLLAAALGLLTTTVSANNFAGLYAGLGLGLTNNNINRRGGYEPRDLGKTALSYQATVGYNYAVNNHWLLGAEAYYLRSPATAYYGRYRTPAATPPKISTSFSIPNVFGLNLLAGYSVTQNILFYAGIGRAHAQFTGSMITRRSDNGWNFLLGAQQAISSKISIREALSHTQYHSGYTPYNAVNKGNETYSTNQNTAIVSFIYNFQNKN